MGKINPRFGEGLLIRALRVSFPFDLDVVSFLSYRFLLMFLLFVAVITPSMAQEIVRNNVTDTNFTTEAPHAIIMDEATGLVLFEKNAREAIAPSSMTKIMTAHIVFDEIKAGRLSLEDKFTVSDNAWRRGGVKSGSSTMFLDPRSEVSVADLLRGVIVQSGNDACIVLAEGISGSEKAFAEMMTRRAKAMGLSSAHFVNSTGWPDDNHVISLYDLAQLAKITREAHPELFKLYAETSFTWNKVKQSNRNPLLGAIKGADGLKTGATQRAGYGLVGTAEQDGIRRIIVINGLESKSQRREVSRYLMTSALQRFATKRLREKEEKVADIDVYLGREKTVPLVLPQALDIGYVLMDEDNITLSLTHPKEVAAPIQAGQKIGDIIVTVPGQPKQSFPVVAGTPVKAKTGLSKALAVLSQKLGN